MQGHLAAGNRLWEWYSVGRYGTACYDVKAQKFVGEEWPEVDLPLTLPKGIISTVAHLLYHS